MGAKVDENLANGRKGVYTYRICGSVMHRLGSLLPADGQQHSFSQIYILDPVEQSARRNEIFGGGLDENLLLKLQTALENVNPYCQKYKSIREREYRYRTHDPTIVLRERRPDTPQRQPGQPRVHPGQYSSRSRSSYTWWSWRKPCTARYCCWVQRAMISKNMKPKQSMTLYTMFYYIQRAIMDGVSSRIRGTTQVDSSRPATSTRTGSK